MHTVEKFEIPNPFSVATVNSYVSTGDEVVVLDPGPASADAFDELEAT